MMAPKPPLPVPTSADMLELLLRMPALKAPAGADKTMTTSGPDQVWYLVVAITCIAVPGLFLAIRIYTKISIVRKIEPADCKTCNTFARALLIGFCRLYR